MIFYTVYETTNLINGKTYIGKHITSDLNDGYFGSGTELIEAIKKYGLENFVTEILHIFDKEEYMNLAERILVVPDKDINYNLVPGGNGFAKGNQFGKVKRSESFKKLLSDKMKERDNPGFKKGYIPWNKGLSKESDLRVLKNAQNTSKGRVGLKIKRVSK